MAFVPDFYRILADRVEELFSELKSKLEDEDPEKSPFAKFKKDLLELVDSQL